MPGQILNADRKAQASKIAAERIVPLHVLGHAMDDLDHWQRLLPSDSLAGLSMMLIHGLCRPVQASLDQALAV